MQEQHRFSQKIRRAAHFGTLQFKKDHRPIIDVEPPALLTLYSRVMMARTVQDAIFIYSLAYAYPFFATTFSKVVSF